MRGTLLVSGAGATAVAYYCARVGLFGTYKITLEKGYNCVNEDDDCPVNVGPFGSYKIPDEVHECADDEFPIVIHHLWSTAYWRSKDGLTEFYKRSLRPIEFIDHRKI